MDFFLGEEGSMHRRNSRRIRVWEVASLRGGGLQGIFSCHGSWAAEHIASVWPRAALAPVS